MSPQYEDGNWVEYRRLVLAELERINLENEAIKKQIENLKVASAENKIKWFVFSGVIGAIFTLIQIVIMYYKG